jgi:uncharacterized protein with FMN-binding domain
MRRVPAVMAGAVGFAGIIALHAGNAPSILGASTPPVSSVPTTTSSGGSGPTTTTSTAPQGVTRTAAGASEQYGYGVLAVKVTVQGAHITDVSVASLQTAEQYSQSLAQQVIPTLRGEVLSAQSARINGISGATYTSEAYAYSVQSALDKLGVK